MSNQFSPSHGQSHPSSSDRPVNPGPSQQRDTPSLPSAQRPGAPNGPVASRAPSYRGLVNGNRTEPGNRMAVAGLVLGIISLVCWFQPFVGLPVAVLSLVLAGRGRRSFSRRTMAVTGQVLAGCGLVLSLCYLAAGPQVTTYLQNLQ